MEDAASQKEDLWQALTRHGINADGFDFRGQQSVDCPYCGQKGTMTLSKSTYRAKCTNCHVDAKLADYVERLDLHIEEALEPDAAPYRPDRQQKSDD